MTCVQYRSELVAYVRGELSPLEQRRLDGHLGHCERCRSVCDVLDGALPLARSYEPDVSEQDLDRLNRWLAPYMERETAHTTWLRPVAVGIALAVVLVVVSLFVVQNGHLGDQTNQPVARSASWTEYTPTPFVRVLADSMWDGSCGKDALVSSCNMTRGVAGFAFSGGEGRRLVISTPHGSVRVLGTVFSVDLSQRGMQVTVQQGVVSVDSTKQQVRLKAGEALYVDPSGETRRVQPKAAILSYLSYPFLQNFHGHKVDVESSARSNGYDFRHLRKGLAGSSCMQIEPNEKPSVERSATVEKDPLAGVLADLEHAEACVEKGEIHKALALYASCASNSELDMVYVDHCLYESARLYGFTLDMPDRARPIFERLVASGVGEARRQAMLALCELDVERAPCVAVKCVTRIANDLSVASSLRREAARLADVWQREAHCGSGL